MQLVSCATNERERKEKELPMNKCFYHFVGNMMLEIDKRPSIPPSNVVQVVCIVAQLGGIRSTVSNMPTKYYCNNNKTAYNSIGRLWPCNTSLKFFTRGRKKQNTSHQRCRHQ